MLFYICLVFGRYFPSKWDPLTKDTRVFKQINNIRGWLSSHQNRISIDTFGDLSIVTYNLYSRGMADATEEQVQAITNILDHMHPTVLALQGVDSELMEKLKTLSRQSKHYFLINTVKNSTDLQNGFDYFLPVFYDARLLQMKANGYFLTNGKDIKVLYASWVRLKSLKTEFTLVNLDLFSSFKDVTNAMFANIISDVRGDKVTSAFPVVFAGSIISMPQSMNELIDNEYKDLLKGDKNNNGLSKTKMHVKGALKDEIIRDFIILRDQYNRYYLNYARILSNFPMIGNHYPVHAILSIVEKSKPQSETKKKQLGTLDALRSLDKNTENAYVETAISEAKALKEKYKS